MGRYSSDSEEERRKRKKKKKRSSRSRSRSESSESRHSIKSKKSKKKKKYRSRSKSRSRSTEKYRRSKSKDKYRSRSRSYSRRSRSYSKERYRKRSRSPSRTRYSRSRSKERRRKRSRSFTPEKRKNKQSFSTEREDPCKSIPGFSEMMHSEQARIRMQMALKAAAAADEKLKGDIPRSHSYPSLQDSMTFSQAVQDIESSAFVSSSFKSNRGDKIKEEKPDRDEFMFGTAGELKLESQRKPILVDIENEDLADPSLYTDPEEKLDRWIQKLYAMRRRKLEGDALA